MRNLALLYRESRDNTMLGPELEAARAHFRCIPQRTQIQPDDLVVGRYSVLPFYRELEADILAVGARLINSTEQHNYAADLSSWYQDLQGLTPETWFDLDHVPADVGPLVVKGLTNSAKFSWDRKMFAASKKEAAEVAWRLQEDITVGGQGLVFRRFVPLKTYLTGLSGLPITEEYRFFCCDRTILCGGYYWSNYTEDLPEQPDPANVPAAFLASVLERIAGKIRFVCVDVARTANGEWLVIELNDAQMSGLSENNPHTLYGNLRAHLERTP